jgi:Htaa
MFAVAVEFSQQLTGAPDSLGEGAPMDEPTPDTRPRPAADQQAEGAKAGRQAFGLLWGIKSSFVEYVRRMPDGQGALGAGARPLDVGGILFPPLRGARRTTPDNVDERIWEFGGDVRFRGHFGMLFVRIAFPTIAVRDGVGVLTVADPYTTEGGERLILADITLQEQPAPPGLLIWSSTEVRMNAEAGKLFNDVYQVGEPLDPLTLVLPDR